MEINTGKLPYSEAAERNCRPILEALTPHLPESGLILEIGSGTGQHIVAFAAHFPEIDWQPSDRPAAVDTVAVRVRSSGLGNLRPSVALDVLQSRWPAGPFTGIYTANTLHIMPWKAGRRLLVKAGEHLAPGGLLSIYGPFFDSDLETAPSNLAFDRQLRARDPLMGLRGIQQVKSIAAEAGFNQVADLAMPANNRLLIWRRS